MKWSFGKRVAVATAIAGTLDITLAIVQTLRHGRAIDGMLRFVASGPFGDTKQWGMAGAALGLAVHYAIMAVMAVVFMVAFDRMRSLREFPVLWGMLYGLGTFIVLDQMIVPRRYGSFLVTSSTEGLITQLFAHIVLVGVTFGLIARKG